MVVVVSRRRRRWRLKKAVVMKLLLLLLSDVCFSVCFRFSSQHCKHWARMPLEQPKLGHRAGQ